MEIDTTLLNFKKADIFTPNKISKIMTHFLIPCGSLLEPAVGDEQLLKYINPSIYSNIDIFDIKKEYLQKCITNLEKQHNTNLPNITAYNNDFIKYEFPTNAKYDNIIMNPPYIKIQDLSPDYRDYLKQKSEILKSGSIDYYYYAFILKGLELLKDDGVMICLTPNAYIYNKSATELRKYLITNKYISKIIDYKHEKIFPKISAYCCITNYIHKKR